MPPRKKSRLTVVGKNKASTFKSLCLPDTGFMVDFLEFFSRDDFEKSLQLTCNRMNQLVLTHFNSKPYRYLDNVTLGCSLNVNKMFRMCLSKPATDHTFLTNWWNPSARQWTNSNRFVGFSRILPFLNNLCVYQNSAMSQEELKFLSHIWENAQVEFTTGIYSKKNLVSCAELLNETKLFRCRRFSCSYVDDMLPLWDYPEIYSSEVVEIKFTSIERVDYDLTPITKLVDNRALYPHSQTRFAFSEYKSYRERSTPLFTKTVLQHISNQFMESDKAQSFRIVFTVYEKFETSDEDVDEFRLKNNRTREVLHLRRVTYNEVTKYCENEIFHFGAHSRLVIHRFVCNRCNIVN